VHRDVAQGSCCTGHLPRAAFSECCAHAGCYKMATELFFRELWHLKLPERGARVNQKPGSNAVLKTLECSRRREVLSLQIRIVEGEPPSGDAP